MAKYNIPVLQAFVERHAKDYWIAARRLFGDKIGAMPAIKINARLTSTAGRAFLEQGYCDFSAYLLNNNLDYFAADTIPHELCHHIAWRLYGEDGHGKAWKQVCLQVYGKNNRCHTMQTKYQAERKTK